jgi:hypothetical protein
VGLDSIEVDEEKRDTGGGVLDFNQETDCNHNYLIDLLSIATYDFVINCKRFDLMTSLGDKLNIFTVGVSLRFFLIEKTQVFV